VTHPTEISVNIQTVCRVCSLPLQCWVTNEGRLGWQVRVEPCPDCLGRDEAAGYERCERENNL